MSVSGSQGTRGPPVCSPPSTAEPRALGQPYVKTGETNFKDGFAPQVAGTAKAAGREVLRHLNTRAGAVEMVPGGSDLGWGAPCRGPGGGFSARGGGRTSGQEGMGAQSRQAPGTALSRLLGKGLRGESAAGLSRGEVHEARGPGEKHVLCPSSPGTIGRCSEERKGSCRGGKGVCGPQGAENRGVWARVGRRRGSWGPGA